MLFCILPPNLGIPPDGRTDRRHLKMKFIVFLEKMEISNTFLCVLKKKVYKF